MTHDSKNALADPDEAALSWAGRLRSGDVSAGDEAAFRQWLGRDEANRIAWARLETLWQEVGDLPAVAKPSRARRRPASQYALAVAAVLIGVLVLPHYVQRLTVDQATAVGEIRRIELPDGSKLTLNTETRVNLAFDGTRRGVELIRGEALFEVVPDLARPFIVQLAGGSVEVTGTIFSLRVLDDPPVLAVTEGSVRAVVGDRAPLSVQTAEAVLLDKYGARRLDLSAQSLTSWADGVLSFESAALHDVIDEIDRYRPGRVFVVAPPAGDRR
ncbi:MAG: FecR domain-containing protein, partial [Pseudomonadota bacterium]